MEKVDQIINQSLRDEAFGVQELSRSLCTSYSTLYRYVKKETGYSPSIYIRIKRLETAHILLIHSDLSISEIAYACGFHTLPYFSRCFKAYFQFPPSQIRKK